MRHKKFAGICNYQTYGNEAYESAIPEANAPLQPDKSVCNLLTCHFG